MSLYRAEAFARLQNVPERFYVFVNTIKLLRLSFGVLRNAIGVVLIAFLIHQVCPLVANHLLLRNHTDTYTARLTRVAVFLALCRP